MTFTQALGLALVFALAGGVKGITGMGLPTVVVSLLGLWMAPAQVAALLVAPSLATNLTQCRGPHGRMLVAKLWPMWLCLVGVTVLAPELGTRAAIGLTPNQLLGAVLVVYGTWGLWRPALPDLSQRSRWIGAAVGATTGWLAATTAVFAMPLAPYLQTLKLDKNEMVQALGLSFTVATLALAARLQASSTLDLFSWSVLLAIAAAFAGLAFGTHLRARLSGPAFQKALFLTFIGLGAANLLRGL
ncbi:MAG: sulfite exporter TauE/SafE family protein [Rhizobacter sp.]